MDDIECQETMATNRPRPSEFSSVSAQKNVLGSVHVFLAPYQGMRHHAIEQQPLAHSQLLKMLADSGRFDMDMDASSNLINMPNHKTLAHSLGVSPHSGGLIRDYRNGLKSVLDDLEVT